MIVKQKFYKRSSNYYYRSRSQVPAAKKPEKRKAESESESESDSEDSSSDIDSEDDKPCAERSKAPLPVQCSAADDRALKGAIKKVAPTLYPRQDAAKSTATKDVTAEAHGDEVADAKKARCKP